MAPAQKKRFKAMAAARQEIETITAQRRVAASLKHRAGALSHPIYEFGYSVRVWREEAQRDEGPSIFRIPFVHIRDILVLFSTSVIKVVHPEQISHPATEPRQAPPVPGDVIYELEQLQSQYGNLSEQFSDRISEETNAFLSSTSARDEIGGLV